MLFAAGFGTRMGALTKDRPKSLIKVNGKALLDHAIDHARIMSPRRIVVNAHYKHDKIVDHLKGQDISVSIEQPDILDTGGGLGHALPLLEATTVFTMNTDAIWRGPEPLPILSKAWDPDRMDALLLCIPCAQAIGHAGDGDFHLQPDWQIKRGPGYIYSGVQIIKTNRLAGIKDRAFSLNLLWNMMAEDGRLFGAAYPGHWCDVGHPNGIELAETMLAGNV